MKDKHDKADLRLEDIHKNITNMKRELLNLRFQKAVGELNDTSRFRQIRVEIARQYTLLNSSKK